MEMKGNVQNGMKSRLEAGARLMKLAGNPFYIRNGRGQSNKYVDAGGMLLEIPADVAARSARRQWLLEMKSAAKATLCFNGKAVPDAQPAAAVAQETQKEKPWNHPSYFFAGVYYGPGMPSSQRVFFDLPL
ncbi:Uncharacterised protein [uncultured archaeon]|nr:Uncharacterised protein [uncultured archaeon]